VLAMATRVRAQLAEEGRSESDSADVSEREVASATAAARCVVPLRCLTPPWCGAMTLACRDIGFGAKCRFNAVGFRGFVGGGEGLEFKSLGVKSSGFSVKGVALKLQGTGSGCGEQGLWFRVQETGSGAGCTEVDGTAAATFRKLPTPPWCRRCVAGV